MNIESKPLVIDVTGELMNKEKVIIGLCPSCVR